MDSDKTSKQDFGYTFFATALYLAVFMVDSVTPRDFEVWLLYFLPILLNFPVRARNVFLLSFAATVLIVVGFFVSLAEGKSYFLIINRILGIGLLWFAGFRMKQRIFVEERLRESESRYRAIFELAGAGAIEVDPRTNCFLRVNSSFCRLTGYSVEELERMTYVDLTFPADRERDKNNFPRLVRGDIPAYDTEKRYVRKDGTVIWVRISATMVRDAQGMAQRTVGIVLDINDLQLGHEALNRERMLLQTIFNTVPVMFTLYEPKIRKMQLNAQFVKVLGWTSTDADSPDFLAKIIPDPRHRHEIEEFMHSLTPGYRDITVTAKDGSRVETSWANVALPDGRQVGIGFDIRARKRAEESLRRAEEHLRLAVEAGKEGTWDYDPVSGIVVLGSRAREILGLPLNAPITFEMVLQAVYSVDSEHVQRSLNHAFLPSSDGNFTSEYRVFHPDGTLHWVNERGKVYFSGDGRERKAYRFIGIVRDVTDSKRAEEILQRDKETFETLVRERSKKLFEAQRELDRSRRLSDIGQLAATIAHELRNPLTAIDLAGASIRRKACDPAVTASSENIRKKVGESNRIIDDLLCFTRMRAPVFEDVPVFELLKECVKVAGERYPESRFHVDADLGSLVGITIRADAEQLSRVFANLLNNAFESIPASREGHVSVKARADAGRVVVIVTDNGSGMTEQTREKLFEPFFTTKSSGTGLGLPVVSQIVRMHKGSVSVDSQAGTGTKMTVILPMDSDSRHE